MKLPELSITRAKQLDVVGGALILCFLLLGKWPFEKPTWLRSPLCGRRGHHWHPAGGIPSPGKDG